MAEGTTNIRYSIIVPVFNAQPYLKSCVDSLLVQAHKHYEVLLIDDHSTDDSGAICDQYAAAYPQVRVHHLPSNQGASAARNLGIQEARGTYILFVDADDFWKGTQILNELDDLIASRAPDIILHPVIRYYAPRQMESQFFPEGITNHGFFGEHFEELVYQGVFAPSPWDKIIKRELLTNHHLFFPQGVRAEDMKWCADLVPPLSTYALFPSAFYHYRQGGGGSVTQNLTSQHVENVFEMIRNGLSQVRQADASLKTGLENYWATNFIDLLMFYPLLNKKARVKIKPYLKEWAYLIRKGRSKKMDQVARMSRVIPYSLLPNALFAYSRLRQLQKRMKTYL
ncbi:glycosyltransferase family 2 protein [Croceiramulus getboli]|nr:glycosyltransferase family 2 protein [Flavobacteriaceae bacterium YJPT1-3]